MLTQFRAGRGFSDSLVTYFYLLQKKPEILIETLQWVRASTRRFLMLDSGAFSWRTQVHQKAAGRKQTKRQGRLAISVEEFARRYIEFVKKTHPLFDVIAELDVDNITGYDFVKEVRSELVKVAGHEKVMPVYHDSIPARFREWDTWTHQFKYAAVGGKPGHDVLHKLFALAYCNGTVQLRVHGFAYVDVATLLKFPFYSVDSTSWLAPERFGRTLELENNLLIAIAPDVRKGFLVDESGDKPGPLRLHLSDFVENRLVKNHSLSESVDVYEAFSDVLTQYWESKGVVWPELQKQ